MSDRIYNSANDGPSAEDSELGQFIPMLYHFHMLADEARLTAFEDAINYVVQPGAKVLELGGGSGVLSYFAAKHAAQVWCIERLPELVQASREFLDAPSVPI